MEQVTKEEILNIFIKNGIDKERASELLELLSKGLGHSFIDILELVVNKTENKIDDVVFASIKGLLVKVVDNIEVTL